jgi:lysozyme family protein
MSFDAAFQKTLGSEGVYSFDPNDPGGETMWGVTAATARAYGYQGAMKAMPILTAKRIYLLAFWELLHLDKIDSISPAIAAELFDTAVNCGASIPVPYLQKWLNAFNRQAKDYPDLVADGLAGTVTCSALRTFLARRGKQGERVMIAALNADQAIHYRDIVERRPKSEDYIFGWMLNRVLGDSSS